jgi:hypothetical protein
MPPLAQSFAADGRLIPAAGVSSLHETAKAGTLNTAY